MPSESNTRAIAPFDSTPPATDWVPGGCSLDFLFRFASRQNEKQAGWRVRKNRTLSNVFGNRRMAFAEVMDAAEKHGKLLIISTNLPVDDIRKRYGDRVLDRIKSTTTRILFEGESLRQ
ncbi:hypothetical protein [Dysgonomonas gadei]|uniref:hypothetical protein n=1 Tax=Dysgonomonas gadei TaxID=156974 RepID=UPI0005C64D23|nr:hypothetical protein [Dysgonomonas gadei]